MNDERAAEQPEAGALAALRELAEAGEAASLFPHGEDVSRFNEALRAAYEVLDAAAAPAVEQEAPPMNADESTWQAYEVAVSYTHGREATQRERDAVVEAVVASARVVEQEARPDDVPTYEQLFQMSAEALVEQEARPAAQSERDARIEAAAKAAYALGNNLHPWDDASTVLRLKYLTAASMAAPVPSDHAGRRAAVARALGEWLLVAGWLDRFTAGEARVAIDALTDRALAAADAAAPTTEGDG